MPSDEEGAPAGGCPSVTFGPAPGASLWVRSGVLYLLVGLGGAEIGVAASPSGQAGGFVAFGVGWGLVGLQVGLYPSCDALVSYKSRAIEGRVTMLLEQK